MSVPAPEVSVVVGARDAGDDLEPSLVSVLEQRGVDLELIVVDDGSTDATGERLAALAASDSRVRVLRQQRLGLTAALRRGCAAAVAPLVARHDVGDRSLAGRLARQATLFAAHPRLVLAACAAEVVAPGGELLWIERGGAPPDVPLPMFGAAPGREWIGPPAHGAAMFRRADYESVGGYREEFALGQDWDLWLRLGERGEILVLGDPLYRRRLDPGSLSLRHRRLQRAFGAASSEASRRRRRDASEAAALARARELSTGYVRLAARAGRAGLAAGEYHVGEALRRAGHVRSAISYFARAARLAPWRLRAWLRLAQSLLAARAQGKTA